MEFPFDVVFEPPSQSELRAWLRLRRVWIAGALILLAVGTATGVMALGRSDALASGPTVPLSVVSYPSHASVWLDDRERGHTPLDLPVTPGRHAVSIRAPGAQDGQYELNVGPDGARLEANLFRSRPLVTHLRAALPGATLTDVRLLADGQLALSLTLAPGHLEAWRLDPQTGITAKLVTDLTGTRVVVAGDGAHVAYTGREVGPPAGGPQSAASGGVLWLLQQPFAGVYAGWRAPPGEVVLDASWSPDADGVLVSTGRPQSTADASTNTRLWWLDAAGEHARELRSLPSQVVPGSEAWSPDGQHVALLVHAGALNALCLLGVDGDFRYLADLEPSSELPLAYAPVAWASDSQSLLFTAPEQRDAPPAPSIWFQPPPTHALFEARLSDAMPTIIAEAQLVAPGWLPDGRPAGLGRGAAGDGGGVSVQVLGSGNRLDRLLEVPLKPGRGYAAEWDTAHSRAVIANRTSSGTTDYWAVLLGAEEPADTAS